MYFFNEKQYKENIEQVNAISAKLFCGKLLNAKSLQEIFGLLLVFIQARETE